MTTTQRTNWAGNVTYRPGALHRPRTIAQVQELVAASEAIRPVGTGHSFNDIADGRAAQLSLDALEQPTLVDRESTTVTVGAGLRYAQLTADLDAAGLALHNLGSLPHISVAGACATGTHGSGDANGNLATAVSAIDLVTADGQLRTLRRDRDSDRFPGVVVGLGALGVVVRLTLDVVPTFGVRQWVYSGLSWSALHAHLDEIFASGYSVSVFTRWHSAEAGTVWIKRREHDPRPDGDLFGARPSGPSHPVPGMPPENCTLQDGIAGAWHERLPHFRAEFLPSSGQELQSEYLVPREHASAALTALFALREQIAPLLQVCELRTVAQDDLWLSPSYGRDVLGIHFTWIDDEAAVLRVLREVEAALAPFSPRPHWGKLFVTPPEQVRAAYPRFEDFAALVRELDPRQTFGNAFLDRLLH
ncbi:D-arabinono-1,4-lactone oxidase [Lipingzhangella sp. LS1_29]|uniref:D-arabinono-1,4-lactone oxidase n=1 Tax=Lipingzhangella rawalii TaxID=2055835 RepID=A0ABU2H6W4_9ACTN|nr:D-arabinono-1,4-lactone oxidase [Lipingzhangella rawalii]MDS1271046.1 D-arabinono-1,4-lactone oxidase [Lipingzhangella rawalii]